MHRAGTVTNCDLNEGFSAFIAQSKAFFAKAEAIAPIPQFQQFIERSVHSLASPLEHDVQAIVPDLVRLNRWLIPRNCDLLDVGGVTFDEDAYTELIRWALCPQANPTTAFACQRTWLRRLGFVDKELPSRPATVRSQLVTKLDGNPDLLLWFPNWVIVVEAKTGTLEHAAPSGKMQTEAYESAVRSALSLSREVQVDVVYLTLDRSQPHSRLAVPATYLELAFALAEGLETVDIEATLRFAYSMIISHFATAGLPAILPIRTFAQLADTWHDVAARATACQKHLRGLLALRRLLNIEAHRDV